jgi:HTH-type transcriptional regulator, sugar sensing transcriptional regulator
MTNLSKNLLSSLNLTETQAAVYIAALELGQGTMQDLARKSGIKRTSIYNFIEDLKARGLINEAKKKKRRVYSAVDPEQLLEIEKTRINELERALPELQAIKNTSQTKPKVTFYEGLEQVLDVYTDQLKTKQPVFAFEDLEQMVDTMPKFFVEWWPKERAKRNIPFKSILRDSPTAQEFTKKNIKYLRQSKLIKTGDWKTEINIYGDKVAMMSFRVDPPFCVVIEDQDIAETLRTAWQDLWDRIDEPVIG